MEGYETVYDLEEPAGELGPEQQEEEAEQEEDAGLEEVTEPEEAEQEEDTGPEQQGEEAGQEENTEPEEEPEEEPGQETASGNDLSVSENDSAAGGDVTVSSEDYDLSAPGGELPDTESIVQAVEKQGDIMTAGFTCTCFMLGVLAGALVITGFRVRRV